MSGAGDGPVTVWANWNVRETMPDPFAPLTWSIWMRSILPALEASATQALDLPPVDERGDADLLGELVLIGAKETLVLRDGLALANAAFFLWLATDKLFTPWPAARRLLAAGVKGNPTTAISAGIDKLVETARPLAKAFLGAGDVLAALRAGDSTSLDWVAELDAFLAEFGHRAPREFDLLQPRWADDPSMVLALVRARLPEAPGIGVEARLDAAVYSRCRHRHGSRGPRRHPPPVKRRSRPGRRRGGHRRTQIRDDCQ